MQRMALTTKRQLPTPKTPKLARTVSDITMNTDKNLSGLVSTWLVSRYSWNIEEVGFRVGFRPAETGLNRGPYQPSVSW